MVEDEFLATARAFTAHLHHAEYLRLKNAAKARSEKAVDGIGIERPVDGVTAMRAETRKQKEAEAKEKKVRGAVDSIVAPGEGRRPSDGEGSDISDLEEGERHDDPWQGTQLQRFMTRSPKKGLKGLTGLQGVVSHTRAAAGFQKPEKRDTRGVSPTPARGVDGMKGRDGEEEDDEEDTDDLDAPAYPRPRPPTHRTPSLTKPKPKPSQPAATTTAAAVKRPPKPKPNPHHLPHPRAVLDVTPLPKPPPKCPPDPQPVIKRPEPVIKFESHDRGGDVLRGIRERSEARRTRREREREKRGREGGGMGSDEIPVFLV